MNLFDALVIAVASAGAVNACILLAFGIVELIELISGFFEARAAGRSLRERGRRC